MRQRRRAEGAAGRGDGAARGPRRERTFVSRWVAVAPSNTPDDIADAGAFERCDDGFQIPTDTPARHGLRPFTTNTFNDDNASEFIDIQAILDDFIAKHTSL
jgi:hypothetical protein